MIHQGHHRLPVIILCQDRTNLVRRFLHERSMKRRIGWKCPGGEGPATRCLRYGALYAVALARKEEMPGSVVIGEVDAIIFRNREHRSERQPYYAADGIFPLQHRGGAADAKTQLKRLLLRECAGG